jgi:spore maturation protein CgeB
MNLVIFGLTISSSWGNGHATLWRGLCGALARPGHRVCFFERDRPYYAAHRDRTGIEGGRLVIYGDWAEVRADAEREVAAADAAIVTSYCADAVAAAELMAEASPGRRIFYDLDTPVTLAALREGAAVDYLGPEGLRNYDLVLSYTGGRALEELVERLGARRVATLYGSVDPEVHRPVRPEAGFAADLSYLGTYAADRQAALEALFVEPARRSGYRFLIGGAQYPDSFPWAPNIFFVRHVEPAQHPAFFSSSRLTLNVTRAAMKAMGHCPSGRLFEAAACGAPLVSDRWEGLEQFFAPREEILVAESGEDVLAALELPAETLKRMAQRARERVLAQHTAMHRAMELETILAGAGAARDRETAELAPTEVA